MADEKIVLEFKNTSLIALLVILLVFFVLELQVTIPNPITFGDEAFHTGMARYIAIERDYPAWVTIAGTDNTGRINFAKPVMLNLLLSGFFLIFGFSETIVKFLIPFIPLVTSLAIYILVKSLYDGKIGFIAAIVFVSIPSVVTYSVTAYAEPLVTFYYSLSILLLLYSIKTGKQKYILLTGIFTALAFLTEVSSLTLIAFFFLAFFYNLVTKGSFPIKRYLPLFIIFVVLIIGFLIRNVYTYGTPICYLQHTGIQFIDRFVDYPGCSYKTQKVSEPKFHYQGIRDQAGSDQSVYRMGITNFLDFAYGNIWFVVLGVFGGIVISLYKRDLISTLLVLVLPTYVLYFHFTSGRAEDAARNLLAWTPIFAIFTGIYFGRLYEFLQSHQKYIAVIVFLIVIILAYQNLTPKLSVMNQVKQFSPAFFEACDWTKENLPRDAVLSTVWVYRAAYSCERTAVGNSPDIFLSKDLKLIKETADEDGITHLFIQKFSLSNQAFSESYLIDSVEFFENNPSDFKKVFENGSPLQQCIQQGGCDGNIIYEIV